MRISVRKFGFYRTYRSVIFWGLILSYTIIFLLPNVFAIITYEKYSASLEKKVVSSLDNNLSQVQNIVDGQIANLNELPVKMHRNKRLYSILTAQDLGRFSSYDLYEGITELSNYKAMNNFIDEVLFFKPKLDFVISTTIATDFYTYYNSNLRYDNISKEELEKRMSNVPQATIWPIESMWEQNVKSEKITYVKDLSHDGINNIDVRLLATINNDKFTDLFNKVLGNYTGSIYIINEKGQIISSLVKDGYEADNNLLESYAVENKNYSTTIVNGNEVLVTSIQSKQLGWSYIAIIPTDQIFNELNKIRNTSFLTSILIFLGCSLLTVYFANRNYKPVLNVVNMLIPEKNRLKALKYTNEWEVIRNEVNSTIRGKKSLEDYLSQQMPVLRSNYILLLMKGSSKKTDSTSLKFKHLELQIEKGPFAVMLISIDGYRETSGLDKSINDEDMLLYKSAVRNVVEELCMEKGIGYTTEPGEDEVGVLVRFEGIDEEENYEAMKRNSQKILETFYKYFNLTLTIGLGNIYLEASEIKNSYREARIALEYKIIKGNSTIIKYNDIKVVPGFINYYSVINEKEILDCLKKGDIEGIKEILNEIMKNLRENLPPLETARCIYFEILNTALRAFNLVGIESYNSLQINTRFQALFYSDTIEQLYSETLEFYRDICNYINGRKESKNFKLAGEIQEYIDQNYTDSNFSLIVLADYFRLSASYLSRFFKDQFGYTISEYLQKKRVDAAKTLLGTTSKNIVSIAEELGFGNVHSFINTFKKHEGITPGEYRTKITNL